MNELELGEIVLTYSITEDGDIMSGLSITGEIPVAMQLGLLELAKDTILRGIYEDDDE